MQSVCIPGCPGNVRHGEQRRKDQFSLRTSTLAIYCCISVTSSDPSHTLKHAQVFDQYLSFVALEAGLFSLSLPDSYLQLNDPAAQDTQIEASVTAVVDGLFSALVALGVVPIIRCPKVRPWYCPSWLGQSRLHWRCCALFPSRLSYTFCDTHEAFQSEAWPLVVAA